VAQAIYILAWLLPMVAVSLGVGVYLGYGFALRRKASEIHDERAKTLKTLQMVLRSTEELSCDVDAHNRDLQSVGRSVEEIHGTDDFDKVQQALIEQIFNVVESNKRLEDDLVCTRYQLEQQAQELDRTRIEARTDNLSRVANRMAFEESLPFQLSNFKRTGQPFALVLLDVDHFKWINDTHGHLAGDQVIIILGATLKSLLRARDFVARYGGDEFAILLPDVDLDMAIHMVQRIRREIDHTTFNVGVGGARVAVTTSMGMAMSQREDTPDSLLQKADDALYRSKNGGRNQFRWYECRGAEGATVSGNIVPSHA
jgi:diguanylate cyclase